MREIKFRDFDLEKKEMRCFDLDHYDKNEHDWYGNIMQFTGLKDKNGKEIYEGDILQTKTGIASVIWDDASFALLSPGSEAVDWEHSSVYELSEVIGNIHENSNLL